MAPLFALMLLPLSLCGFFGRNILILDQTSHFRIAYLIAAVILVPSCAFARSHRKIWIVVAGTALVINAWAVLPWYFPGDSTTEAKTELTVLLSNVYTRNTNKQGVINLILEKKPEVLVLLEVNDAWMESLEKIKSEYPYRISKPRHDNFGIALFSRLPLIDPKIFSIGSTGVPSILCSIEKDGMRTAFIATHTLPPVSAEYFEFRNEQLIKLAQRAAAEKGNLIVAGDLNISMWSECYAEFIEKSGLRNGRKGFGPLPTWPSFLPLLPLDHILCSKGMRVKALEIPSSMGSDHLPLFATIGMPE
ncbi:MAG: endonuclease/exonuclease/phosphatase family protein [Planctomycetes bacterium]|nr:endonuclease/exonuclease/phosphatase family protein [Planctomycetota bacterium]